MRFFLLIMILVFPVWAVSDEFFGDAEKISAYEMEEFCILLPEYIETQEDLQEEFALELAQASHLTLSEKFQHLQTWLNSIEGLPEDFQDWLEWRGQNLESESSLADGQSVGKSGNNSMQMGQSMGMPASGGAKQGRSMGMSGGGGAKQGKPMSMPSGDGAKQGKPMGMPSGDGAKQGKPMGMPANNSTGNMNEPVMEMDKNMVIKKGGELTNEELTGQNMGSQMPNQSMGQGMGSQMPNQSMGQGMGSQMPNQSMGQGMGSQMPNQSMGQGMGSQMPNQSMGQGMGSQMPNQSMGQGMGSQMPNQSMGQGMGSQMPNQSMGQGMPFNPQDMMYFMQFLQENIDVQKRFESWKKDKASQ